MKVPAYQQWNNTVCEQTPRHVNLIIIFRVEQPVGNSPSGTFLKIFSFSWLRSFFGVSAYVQSAKCTKHKSLVLGGAFLVFSLPMSRATTCVMARTMTTKSLIFSLFYYIKFGTLNVCRDPKKVPNSKKIEIFYENRQWAVPNWVFPNSEPDN